MMRVLIAAMLGGLVLFVWGAVSWTVLQWHGVENLQNEGPIVAAMQAGNNKSGAYFIPGKPATMSNEDWAKRHEAGPVAFLFYQAEGSPPMEPMVFVTGLVIDIIAALAAAIVLALGRGRRGYIGRVAIVALLGVLIAMAADATYWNFMHFPDEFALVGIADRIIAWLLVGLVMAAVIKDPRPKVVVAAA